MLQLPLIGLILGLAVHDVFATENQTFPKQIAVVRRRPGLTHKEYLYYHTLVHGLKAWNAPRDDSFPAAYIQDYVFDSVFGANNSIPNQVYVGRDDVTELYGSSATSFTSPPTTNYTATVIGPDGYNFNDFPTAFSMLAYETLITGLPVSQNSIKPRGNLGPLVAFFWAAATNGSTSNDTFARTVADALIQSLPIGAIYKASLHIPVPGADTRPYFGGESMPTMNAVIKMWLYDSDTSISAVRTAQTTLDNEKLHLDENLSFMLFSRAVTIWDLEKNIQFDEARLSATLQAHTY